MRAQYNKNFMIKSTLDVVFDKDIEVYLNNELTTGFIGFSINFVPSRYKDKDKYTVNIDFISADLIQDNINFSYTFHI